MRRMIRKTDYHFLASVSAVQKKGYRREKAEKITRFYTANRLLY